MATEATGVKDLRKQQLDAMQAKADETNKAREGKGTRVMVGQTRGQNPQVITWEEFDKTLPDTLPSTIAEFMELSGVKEQAPIVGLLIDGLNEQNYKAASDPIAEFIDASWPEDIKAKFRIVVRNYATATGTSLEDAVDIIKPGIVKSLQKTAPTA